MPSYRKSQLRLIPGMRSTWYGVKSLASMLWGKWTIMGLDSLPSVQSTNWSLLTPSSRWRTGLRPPGSTHAQNIGISLTVPQKDRQDVLTTRVMRGAECWTDHLMVRSNLLMNIQPRSPRIASYKKLNYTALNSHTTKETSDGSLLKTSTRSADWPALRQAIYNAALEALDQLRRLARL